MSNKHSALVATARYRARASKCAAKPPRRRAEAHLPVHPHAEMQASPPPFLQQVSLHVDSQLVTANTTGEIDFVC